jgi:hypothetical protein
MPKGCDDSALLAHERGMREQVCKQSAMKLHANSRPKYMKFSRNPNQVKMENGRFVKIIAEIPQVSNSNISKP